MYVHARRQATNKLYKRQQCGRSLGDEFLFWLIKIIIFIIFNLSADGYVLVEAKVKRADIIGFIINNDKSVRKRSYGHYGRLQDRVKYQRVDRRVAFVTYNLNKTK